MSNWISVEDELPDIDSLVVILDSNDTNPEYDFARWNGEYWTRKAWPLGYIPSHWMPLPGLPRDN